MYIRKRTVTEEDDIWECYSCNDDAVDEYGTYWEVGGYKFCEACAQEYIDDDSDEL